MVYNYLYCIPDIIVDLSRKHLLDAIWNGELADELQQRGLTERICMSPHVTRENLMEKIDEIRRTELYPHPPENCSVECRTRGLYFFICTRIMLILIIIIIIIYFLKSASY